MQLFLCLSVSVSAESHLKCYSMVAVKFPALMLEQEGKLSGVLSIYLLNVVCVEKNE